ncbi:hypothetical protein BBI11_04215 [Planococcus maritimus]|uniref:hypothetical protein n=1 Tax=Planococcus maritimus TaxID=192421 RepID=UPI00080EF4D7|nr:hypothetical protein [Planococcus maritimus]ANU16308.1 hypothetical protein BBI11_04215 [Planococcus maritimus]
MFVYYAKFNINSNVEELKKDKSKLENILGELAHELDTKPQEYVFENEISYYVNQDEFDENGNEIKKKILEIDTYRFINTKRLKEDHGDIIIGDLMREKPDTIKIYNNKTQKIETSGISRRVFSTTFIFDLRSEIIAFTERQGMGKNQFIKAFEELTKTILEDKAIKIILKQNSENFEERVRELTRVNQINVEIISPNFVDKELDEIEKEAKEIGEKMDEQNITKMEYYIETSEENNKGIDLEGEYAKEVLHKFSVMGFLGYSKAVITGFIGKHAKTVKSEKDTPLVTSISYEDRENTEYFKDHVLNAITGEAIKQTVKNQKNSTKVQKKSDS